MSTDKPNVDILSEPFRTTLANLCFRPYHQYRKKYYPAWNHWGLYLNRGATLAIVDYLVEVIQRDRDGFDFICPIPTSGFPLGAMLFQRLNVPFFASFHWRDAEFHAESLLRDLCRTLPQGRPRVCAIDSSVNTGASLYITKRLLEERLDATIELVATIVDNDLVHKDQIDPIKTEFIQNGKLKAIYRTSDLERLWTDKDLDHIAARLPTG